MYSTEETRTKAILDIPKVAKDVQHIGSDEVMRLCRDAKKALL